MCQNQNLYILGVIYDTYMTLKYRTTKIPDYYFKQIEEYISTTNKHVSVSEFLRDAIRAMFEKKQEQQYSFLLLKDLIFTKNSLIHIHDLIIQVTKADSSKILKDTFQQIVEESLDTDLYRFLAKVLYNFGLYHPFKDANKRTAFIAIDSFLRLNNKKLTLKARTKTETRDEVFLWQTSIQQKQIPEIAQFLKSHVEPYASKQDVEAEIQKSIKENSLLLKKLSR